MVDNGLAQTIGRSAVAFLRKHIVPAAKRVGADFLEVFVPEFAASDNGREKFNGAAKNVGRQTL